MKKLIFTLGAILSFSLVAFNHAANFTSANLLSGTNLVLYTGTSATTFKYDDSYATNRRYVAKPFTLDTNGAIVTTTSVIPKATNSVSGALVPSFELPAKDWSDALGQSPANLALTVYGTEAGAYTNTIALTFVRSQDGGATYATDDTNGTFTFTWDPFNTALSTNLPATFLAGASHIRLWKVVSGANGVASTVTIYHLNLSGYTP